MRNFHLLFIAIVFICGILAAAYSVFAFLSTTFLFCVAIALFAFLVLYRKKDVPFLIFLCILVFLAGSIRYNIFNRIDKPNIKNFLPFLRDEVLLYGKVASDPEESPAGKKENFVLEAASAGDGSRNYRTSGFVFVNVYDKNSRGFKYGDMVTLRGILRQPFSYRSKQNFDYRKYLENKRIYSTFNVKQGSFSEKVGEDEGFVTRGIRGLYSIRERLERHINEYLKAPYDAMLTAILIGKRKGIPGGLKELFAKTGTLHILAISGLHVGIIYFALRVILKILGLPRGVAAVLTVVFLMCFAVLTGARASILRAATMFSILAFGEILKRKTGSFNLLGLSGLIILMINPNQVFNTGFILSYMALLSILGISPLFYRIFRLGNNASGKNDTVGKRIRRYLLRPISVSLAIFVGLTPLSAYYFGLITPVVILANLAVIPLLFLVMASGILFVSLGFLSRFLALAFSQSAEIFLVGLVKSVEFLEKVPFAYFKVKPPTIPALLAYYGVVFAIVAASYIYAMGERDI
ncbi:MAG: ComEC family competence protein [Omnitrophica bacterium]|nr:ComEC family competence protein [Candidatus Omnitrophota bacterium]